MKLPVVSVSLRAAYWLFLTAALTEGRTAKYAALASDFDKICALSAELKGAHRYAHKKLNAAAVFVDALEMLTDQLRIFTTASSNSLDKQLAAAVATSGQKLLKQKKHQYRQLAEKGLTLAARAALVAGHTTEFLNLLAQFTGNNPTDGGCIVTAGTGASASTWGGIDGLPTGCKSTKILEATESPGRANEKPNFKSVTTVTDLSAPGSYTQAQCTFFGTPGTAGEMPANNAVTGGTIYYAAGAIKNTGSAVVSIQAMQDLQASSNLDRYKEAEQALTAVENHAVDDANTFNSKLYDFLAADHAFLQAAARIIANTSKPGADIANDEGLMKKIKDKIGDDAAKFTSI
uniref:Variant surface glycoprotein 1615 n=1 Tax=Trypanosoma brucei TaxID=5691 RepID=M4TC15_9TRYP|nr:variant surface glycoprotein 1615 [Trypanosoma brucei]